MKKKQLQVRSPLRFPGSKSKVLKKLQPFFKQHHLEYREPFVGGGAIFFGKEKSLTNWLNDKDYNIYNLLQIIQNSPLELSNLVQRTLPTIELWKEYRKEPITNDSVENAFKFLFFNRTNYSGIHSANPIGGLTQNSKYKIDCRWNTDTITKRILECSKKLENVRITNYDYNEVIDAPGNEVFLMIDPPYYEKGSSLYPVYMTHSEHEELASKLSRCQHYFLLTIDDCPKVRELYNWAQIIPEQWFYTINSKKKNNLGKELFITNIESEEVLNLLKFC